MAAVVRAGRFSIWLLVVNFNFIFSIGLQFRADVFQIPQQRQALPVVGNPSATPYTNSKQYCMTHSKKPQHKLQHICRHTKPSAQNQTCKRAAI